MDPNAPDTAPAWDWTWSALRDQVQAWLGPDAVDTLLGYALTTAGALLILVLAWFIGAGAAAGTRSVLRRASVDGTLRSFLATVARWAVLVVGVILCLGTFGVETTSLAALIGGAGVGIGVALQGNLANLASGVVLVAFRPFEEGDWVELTDSGLDGLIDKVGLIYTEILTFRNQRIFLPNNLLLSQPVVNEQSESVRRVDVPIGVSYGSDLDHADRVMRELARRIQDEVGANIDREPRVWWLGYGDSSINAKICVWTDPESIFELQNRIILEIHKTFREEGIEIPFPQRDLHLKEPAVQTLRELAAK